MKLYKRTITLVLLAVLLSALIPATLAQTITVETDQLAYDPDTLVTISGTASPGVYVAILVKNPLGSNVYVASPLSDGLGAYTAVFRLIVAAPEGTYTVDASAAGATDATTFLVPTGDVPDVNVDPVANAGGPYDGITGVAVSFNGALSTDSDGNIISYSWVGQDGVSETGVTASHAYATAGVYALTLTVTDNDLDTDSNATTVTITDPDDDDDDDEPDIPDPTDAFSIDYIELVHTDYIDYADKLMVYGSGVTAGTTVNIYWDYASGTNALLLNNTEGDPEGTFEVQIKVPSDYYGDHWLWAEDTSQDKTVRSDALPMEPKLKLSPSSGLAGDDVTIKGYGFTDEANFTSITFDGDELMDDPSDIETDEDGYFTYSFDIPDDATYDKYTVRAEDFYEIDATATFTLGASITLDIDEGPTGIIVEVEGRGWTPGATMSFKLDGTLVHVVDDDVVTVRSTGTFSADVVIPDMSSADEYELSAKESGGVKEPAHDDFEVDGLPKIKLSPGYGPPGSIIDITGFNFTQIRDTEVTLDFGGLLGIKTLKTDSNGEFSGTFQAQALAFSPPDWPVLATDEYGLSDDAEFRLGMMVVILSPTSGPSGDYVYLTGTGFEGRGDWNATLGGELIAEGTADTDGVISQFFYAPDLDAGIHDVIVMDIESEIELVTQFTISDTTRVTIDPTDAPNEYNLSIKGYNFADVAGDVEFVLYNASDDWEMEVLMDPGELDAATCADGNFSAYWWTLDDEYITIGDYTINVTGSEGLFVQVPFTLAAEYVDVAPRKALFNRGDVVQFDVSNDFDYPDAYMKIWDPNDNLYWKTGVLGWLKVSGLYTVPYYLQTSGGNPMLLALDAPLGTWTWTFYKSGTKNISQGTLDVGPSTATIITGQMEELSTQVLDLSEKLDGITDDVEADIGELAEDIADAITEMEAIKDDIVSDLAQDIADATQAGQAAQNAVDDLADAMTDLGEAMTDIGDTANNAADAAQTAADAANDAVQAAEDAGDAASGLTGLVYGAIGASLIAALAAIISLMQISRRIAG